MTMDELDKEICEEYDKLPLITKNQIQQAIKCGKPEVIDDAKMYLLVKKFINGGNDMKQEVVKKNENVVDSEKLITGQAPGQLSGQAFLKSYYPEHKELILNGNERREMSLPETMSLGKVMAESGMFLDVKEASQAVVKILAGRELGLAPIVSMTKIYMVQGKVTLSSEIMGGIIKRSGIYDYMVVKHDNTICSLQFLKDGKPIPDANKGIVTFTIDDARRAGVYKQGGGWEKYPKNMLFARALSNGARWYCPHLIAGAYTPEELGVNISENGSVVGDYQVVASVETPLEEREKILTEIKSRFETKEKALEVMKRIKAEMAVDSKTKIFGVAEEIWVRFIANLNKELSNEKTK